MTSSELGVWAPYLVQSQLEDEWGVGELPFPLPWHYAKPSLAVALQCLQVQLHGTVEVCGQPAPPIGVKGTALMDDGVFDAIQAGFGGGCDFGHDGGQHGSLRWGVWAPYLVQSQLEDEWANRPLRAAVVLVAVGTRLAGGGLVIIVVRQVRHVTGRAGHAVNAGAAFCGGLGTLQTELAGHVWTPLDWAPNMVQLQLGYH